MVQLVDEMKNGRLTSGGRFINDNSMDVSRLGLPIVKEVSGIAASRSHRLLPDSRSLVPKGEFHGPRELPSAH